MRICWEMMNSNESWALILRARVLRANSCINHHISSTVWNRIKTEFQNVKENSSILIGNGQNTSFWFDIWRGHSTLADIFHVPAAWHVFLKDTISKFIHNHNWEILQQLIDHCPNNLSNVNKVVLPTENIDDCLVWKLTDTGELSLKQAYSFKCKTNSQPHWSRFVWSKDIPPARSFVSGD